MFSVPFLVSCGLLAGETVFLNFEGVELTGGRDDARKNVSQICVGEFPAYGAGARRDALAQAIARQWADYALDVTTERPAGGNYTMAVVSPTDCGLGGVGVAPVNCGNSNPNSVVFAFLGADDDLSVEAQATVVSQEVAHAFGLVHVDDQRDIMHPIADGSDQSFTDRCRPVSGAVSCEAQHARHCAAGEQNAAQELLDVLGPVGGHPRLMEDEGVGCRVGRHGDRRGAWLGWLPVVAGLLRPRKRA